MGLFSKTEPGPAPQGGSQRTGSESGFFGAKLGVKGKISGGGNLIVMGRLEGECDLNGDLVLAPSAAATGEIKAVTITVSGNVTGNLAARERVHLEKTAVVNGRIATPRLSMVDGADFNGEVEMKKPPEGPSAPEPSADVSGRIAPPRLSMVDGADFNGEVEMKKPPEGPSAPKPSGKK
ncbi:MAG: polymer-forming cytoskeletal protein [Deltaproteobacteria bacterium]|nr:polymer-forming cytoskeletal protein [Deltaproteobacteria bacterium]